MRLCADVEVIQKTVEHLTEHGFRGKNIRMQGDQIEAKDLAELTELVLAASLLNEEDRPTRLSMLLVDGPHRMLHEAHVQFAEPLSLTISSLVKLAAATEPGKSYICVTEGAGDRKIWGVAHRRAFGNFVTIEIVGSGVARIRLSRFTLSHFAPGGDTFLGSSHILALAMKIGVRMNMNADGQSLTAIVGEMLALGHGGTLLVVPHDADDWLTALESVKYQCKRPLTTLRRLRDCIHENRDRADKLQTGSQVDTVEVERTLSVASSCEQSLSHKHAAIARLSAVDGALVIDTALRVRGFGAKISAESLDRVVDVRSFQHDRGELQTPKQIGGMRHQSAAAFVGACRGAFAFVVSQDRKVSLMQWDNTEKVVVVIRGYELLL
jgi:hypothetical protein